MLEKTHSSRHVDHLPVAAYAIKMIDYQLYGREACPTEYEVKPRRPVAHFLYIHSLCEAGCALLAEK